MIEGLVECGSLFTRVARYCCEFCASDPEDYGEYGGGGAGGSIFKKDSIEQGGIILNESFITSVEEDRVVWIEFNAKEEHLEDMRGRSRRGEEPLHGLHEVFGLALANIQK